MTISTTNLRTKQHTGRLNLSISRPTTILVARVNGAHDRGARSITYNEGTGTYALIRSFQALWVGTSPGTYDVGIVMITGISGDAASGTLSLAENGIPWADDLYLTIKLDYPLFPVQPRIASQVFYKFYSTAFPGASASIPPVCDGGPDRVGWMTDSVNVPVSVQIAAGSDDSEIESITNSLTNNNPGMLVGESGWDNDLVLRFLLDVPQGAVITSAYLDVVAHTDTGAGTVKLAITGEKADNPAACTTGADRDSRLKTDPIEWTFSDAWTEGETYQSSDIGSIIQEIVDRPGFAPNNAVQLFLAENGSSGTNGWRMIVAYDGTPADAATLTVNYSIPAKVFNFDLSYDSDTQTGSYAVAEGATIASYGLSVSPSTGVTVDFNTSTGIGTVTITAAGEYWATCSCTDSNGVSQEHFVWLRVHSDADPPYKDFQLSSYEKTFPGGARAQISVHGEVTLSDFPDEATCILWYENEFDGVEGYSNALDTGDGILLCGYLRQETGSDKLSGDDNDRGDTHDYQFSLTTPEALLDNIPLRSVILTTAATPTVWWEYPRYLTNGRGILHYLRWHSSIMHRRPLLGALANTLKRKEMRFEEGTLLGQVNRAAWEQGIRARVCCDELGRLRLVQDTQYFNTAGRAALDVLLDIDEDDLSGEVQYVRSTEARAYVTQLSGMSFDGVNSTPLVSIIPGYQEDGESFTVPERRGGRSANVPQQTLSGQTGSNERVGREHAVANLLIEEFRLTFRGNYVQSLTTIPLYGWYRLDIANTTLARELEVNQVKLLCRSVGLSVNNGDFITTAVFQPEAQGPDGIPGNYPTTLPAAPEPAAPGWEIEEGLPALLVFSSASYRDDDDADWEELQTVAYLCGDKDPWWKIKQRSANPVDVTWWAAAVGKVWRVRGKAGTPVELTPVNAPPNTHSDVAAPTVAGLTPVQYLGDPWQEDRHYILWQWQAAGDLWRGWISYTDNDGLSWSWIELYDGVTLPDQVKPLWMAVNGSHLLVTVWVDEATDILRLLDFTVSTMAYNAQFAMGETTLAELDANTYTAYPATVIDDDNSWWVFGRLNAPQGLSDPEHIITTDDAGSGWSSVANGFDTKFVAALSASLLDGSDRTLSLLVKGT